MQKTATKNGQRAKSYSSFTVFLLCFWYLHFCSVCTWFFEDNCCNSSWILVLFFAFRSVYQSWLSCQVKRWYQWFSRSYSTSKFDFMPFLGVCGPYAAPRYKSNLSLPQLLGTMFLTLMYIFATPVLPSDAGVAFSIINFATPLTQNPRGGGFSDVLGWK